MSSVQFQNVRQAPQKKGLFQTPEPAKTLESAENIAQVQKANLATSYPSYRKLNQPVSKYVDL